MKRFSLLSVLFASLVFASCVEDIEGCLDPLARNFDPTADIECCCEYPELKLNFVYRYDSLVFSTESAYYRSGFMDSIMVTDFSVTMYDYALCGMGFCDTLSNSEMIYVSNGSDSMQAIFKNDIVRLNPNQFNYTVAEARGVNDYDSLTWDFGLSTFMNGIRPYGLGDHVLADLAEEGLWQDGVGYDVFFLELRQGSQLENSISLNFAVGEVSVSSSIVQTFGKREGEGITLDLKADFAALVKDVDFANLTDEEIRAEIVENLSEFVTLR